MLEPDHLVVGAALAGRLEEGLRPLDEVVHRGQW